MTQEEPELKEEDFIQERYQKGKWFIPGSKAILWGMLLVTIAVSVGHWGLGAWWRSYMTSHLESSPFHQVTNRSLSLFLWQHPDLMRVHQKNKGAYLPGFDYYDRIGVRLDAADQIAVAPPELLHRYHNWQRLIGDDVFVRSISTSDLKAFLAGAPEWHPQNWPGAPKSYIDLIASIDSTEHGEDIYDKLPRAVQQGYCGWRNYFAEGDSINSLTISAKDLRMFLGEHPHYKRPYWRNYFLNEQGTESSYLAGLNSLGETDTVPKEALPGFLRAAIHNSRPAANDSKTVLIDGSARTNL